jgi:acetolactate synthase-1/2/3 large subunit
MIWLEQCREWVRKYDPVTQEMIEAKMHHYVFIRMLSESLPANAIIVYDTGGNAIMMGHCFRSKQGQRIFSSNGNTPMFFAMCGAIGAWFAEPTRPIICVIGDGGMSGNVQELQTIVHYGVNIKIFIINNHCLGNTRAYQVQNGKRELACGPDGYSCPDFVKVAQAYGVEARTLKSLDKIPDVLALPGAVVCDVVHDMFCDYQPRMTLWNAGIEEGFPLLTEAEFEENMIVGTLDGWRERRLKYKEMPDV